MRRGAPLLLAAGAAALVAAPAMGATLPRSVLIAAQADARLPAGAVRVSGLGPGLEISRLSVPSGIQARGFAARAQTWPGVLAAQPNDRLKAAADRPGVCATITPDAVDSSVAQATNAFQVSAPTTKPIAILDTGVDGDHPAFAGRIVGPFNALDGSQNAADADGHGTQVAGVAAAAPSLFRGVSPTSPIMPMKIFLANGEGTAQGLVTAIDKAITQGAGVVNISGAGPQADADPADVSVVALAIARAAAAGIITVAAAGNDGNDKPYVPGSLPHVLTVGSGTSLEGRELFSNTGPWLDLLAPGRNMQPPMPGSMCSTGYGPAIGTSYSAPAAAGAAALVQQLRPGLHGDEVIDVLRKAGGSAFNFDSGFGVLNVDAAIKAPAPRRDGNEPDDDVLWVTRAYARANPVRLRKARKNAKLVRVRITGRHVSSAKDPEDVYRVFIPKGWRLNASVTAASKSAALDVALYDRKTGPTDVSRGIDKHLLRATGGFSPGPEISYRSKRSGVYYLAVLAPDVPDPSEDRDAFDAVRRVDGYRLTLTRRKVAAKKRHRGRR